MGKGRDKRKDKRQERKGLTAAKKERKEEKQMQKWQRKQHQILQDAAEYDDVETLLAAYRHQKKVDAICALEEAALPSARVNASLTVHPTNKHEVVLFGGEHWSGKRLKVFNDLLVYRADKDQWRAVVGEYFPAPRSSHQALNYKTHMYIFGGEFTSPSQAASFHFHDLWSFDFKQMEWTEHNVRHGPSARSGHRMVVWKKNFVLFGGFHAEKAQVDLTYFNDLWLLTDVEGAAEWQAVEYGPYDDVPKARSGCCLGCYENTLFMFGGYSAERGEGGQGSRGVSHMDLWQMNLPAMKWQRIRTQGIAPSLRAGMSVCLDRKRGLFFGGVWDCDDGEQDMQSVFHNDLYALNLESYRWFPVHFKEKIKRKTTDHEEEEKEEEEEEGRTRGTEAKGDQQPAGRINALLAVADNRLFLYGGIREEGNQEVTYNDLWVLNLNKLDGWKLIFDETKGDWEGEDEEDGGQESGGDSNSSDDGRTPPAKGGRDVPSASSPSDKWKPLEKVLAKSKGKERADAQHRETAPEKTSGTATTNEQKDEQRYELATAAALVDRLLQDLAAVADAGGVPTPSPGEALPEFYEQSKAFWAEEARQTLLEDGLAAEDIEEEFVAADGLVLAKRRFGEVRPILERLEAAEGKVRQLQSLVALPDSSSSSGGVPKGSAAPHQQTEGCSDSDSDEDSDDDSDG
eukprot:GGOE01020691.1.p1 GENE.GGOE01020691.1~~GGOE01020691.1.p1  ORF type:complete len:685 (-),score=234.22 GGOE01020691.1:332-2386(-)